MGKEIERRFRVKVARLCPNGEDGKPLPPGEYVKQAYFSRDPAIRIRMTGVSSTPASVWGQEAKAVLTIKSDATLERDEWNIPIASLRDAHDMMGLAKVGIIEKVRYKLRVPGQERPWEVDKFLGPHEGLWIAELELSAPDAEFAKPPWLGPEITQDKRYGNVALAADPTRFWEHPATSGVPADGSWP
jgi:adenylate cyclase